MLFLICVSTIAPLAITYVYENFKVFAEMLFFCNVLNLFQYPK